MDIWQALILGVVMAVDCMCIGATDGILECKMKKRKIICIALVFGIMQGLMPTIGYFLGYAIKDYVSAYIPWIASGILFVLGAKNIIEKIVETYKDKKAQKEGKEPIVCEENAIKAKDIFLQGIATSIDALTIGFLYVDKPMSESLITFLIITIATFVLTTITTALGKKIGDKLNKYAPYIAGVVFILLSIKFLIEGINSL